MTLYEAQQDWRHLDRPDFEIPDCIRLISHEFFHHKHPDGLLPAEEISPGLLSRFFSLLLWAFLLLRAADSNTVALRTPTRRLRN